MPLTFITTKKGPWTNRPAYFPIPRDADGKIPAGVPLQITVARAPQIDAAGLTPDDLRVLKGCLLRELDEYDPAETDLTPERVKELEHALEALKRAAKTA